MNSKIIDKCRKIKLVISDVDGVLTDGGMYYSKDGETLKKFNTKDGIGIELLLERNIKTILITREESSITISRGKKLQVEKTLSGILDKENELKNICRVYNVTPDEIAYVGDDINDLKIMNCVGLKCTPVDGVEKIKKIADYICRAEGGKGVLREISELILTYNKN